MRSNVVSEASVSTRVGQWWGAIPFFTASLVILCGAIYVICLLVGYDSFEQVCFNPDLVIFKFEVFRIYTSAVFHISILHLVFNMLALVPIGSGLERILGSVRYLHVLLVIATSNGLLHVVIAYISAHNPIREYSHFMHECGIGFSGIIFAMIVMETSLSAAQSRSIFGLFTVPAKWYAWILLILFQLLVPDVSLLGHLCGILSGFAYTYGLFNPLLLGSSGYSAIENSRVLACCVRRAGFIVGGGIAVGSLPIVSNMSSGAGIGNLWRSLRSWIPQRETPVDERFLGRGRTLGSTRASTTGGRPVSGFDSESDLQARLLNRNSQQEEVSDMTVRGDEIPPVTDGRSLLPIHARFPSQPIPTSPNEEPQQDGDTALKSLVAMGFEQSKATIALAAADGDLTMAVEMLSGME